MANAKNPSAFGGDFSTTPLKKRGRRHRNGSRPRLVQLAIAASADVRPKGAHVSVGLLIECGAHRGPMFRGQHSGRYCSIVQLNGAPIHFGMTSTFLPSCGAVLVRRVRLNSTRSRIRPWIRPGAVSHCASCRQGIGWTNPAQHIRLATGLALSKNKFEIFRRAAGRASEPCHSRRIVHRFLLLLLVSV